MQHRLNHGTAFNHFRPVTLSPASHAARWAVACPARRRTIRIGGLLFLYREQHNPHVVFGSEVACGGGGNIL